MPRQVQVKYVCDCGHYHSYGGGETYEPQGWVTAIERKDFEGKDVIEVQSVESMHDSRSTDEGRKFFAGTACLERWLFEALTPEPESAPPVPEVPAAPRNAYPSGKSEAHQGDVMASPEAKYRDSAPVRSVNRVQGPQRNKTRPSSKESMKPTPLNPCEEPEKITLNSTVSAFHLFSKGVATSSDEIMFALVSEKFGLTKATRLAAKCGWKCHRPLRELRAMLNEQGKGYTKRVKMARQV